ncbi:regulator of G-protein signaling 7-like isoform X2 [Corticium candelabrum]|nr:regulator of G-protein signaling 7-like isoform X2 [Corticium candelabrum]XP_062508916.1 regulator of G-protein signaling 7-like isoform X2 [Corticium candelabrum]
MTDVFQASELVSWLMRRLEIEERVEAVTIASVISKWGFVFAADNSSNSLKDDGTWLRLQSHHFWPSQSGYPDSRDYAIYLAKRAMRSKANHALADYEAEALEQLHHLMDDRWELVIEQARAQLSQLRINKKKDKQMVDSQERAFWRVHRPLPGQLRVVELSKMKMAVAIREPRGYRLFPSGKEDAEIEYYKSRLVHSIVRTQRQCESLIAYAQNYKTYDPCFTTPTPSNPWITDDSELWNLECVRLDYVDKRRAFRWSLHLSELLRDDTGQHAFSLFLDKEFCTENLKFLIECYRFKRAPTSEIPEASEAIFKEFIAFDSPSSINIDAQTYDAIKEATMNPTRYMFEAAQSHIYQLMEKGPYVRFLQSDAYKKLMQQSPVQSRKGFLGIPSLPTFKTRSGSPKPRRSPRASPANTPPITPPIERKQTFSSGMQASNFGQDDFVMELVAGASSEARNNTLRASDRNLPLSTLSPQGLIDAMTKGLGRTSPGSLSTSSSSAGEMLGGHSPVIRHSSLSPTDAQML